MRIYVAGASGALGLPLTRVLCALGHDVIDMSRKGAGDEKLKELGVEISYADALNADDVFASVNETKPDIIIDQLTTLPANPADIIKIIACR